ncbi:chorismate synthase [Candidatus Gracilibacteria bacterium]|nr:chorismate synthase [Candidatus Gracilibacteria bacterium]
MGNTFGKLFRVTTFGESHGGALGCIIDGCPASLALSEEDIQKDLDRRRPGQSAITTPRNEPDKVRIVSGVFEGKTTGAPIGMIVENTSQRSSDYDSLKNVFRPGHADYTWEMKFGFRDYRGGGRSSGRETISRVMAGAVAKKLIAREGVSIIAFAKQVGPIIAQTIEPDFIEKNTVRTADPHKAPEMEAYIAKAKEEGDSVGGIVEIWIKGTPVGLGEPVFDKLNADLAKALVSIPTVKGVEFGAGFGVATKKGSENNDPFTVRGGNISVEKNDAGGISGGISNGEDIVIRVAVKPPSSISKKQQTVSKDKESVELEVKGRHDPCIIPRFIPVAESMVALVIADHFLRYRAIKP